MAAFGCEGSFQRAMISLLILGAIAATCHGQKLYIKHAPSYVVFQSQSEETPISSSDLHNILAAPLGLHFQQTPLIKSTSLLKRPKANVLFTVVTPKEQDLPVGGVASYPVNWDASYVDVEHMMDSVQNTFLDKEPVMLDLQSSNRFFDIKTSSPLFQSLSSSIDSAHSRFLDPKTTFLNRLSTTAEKLTLNSSFSSDEKLLSELQMVDDVISTLKDNKEKLNTKIPDLLSFTLTGLQDVNTQHGADSQKAKEAQDLVIKHINQLVEDLKTLYKDHVVIEVLTAPQVDVAKVRKARSLMAAETNSTFSPIRLNLEIDWYKDFPVIFNIVLWLMIVLLITVFFVAYGIWNLNPNLESILYRVPQDDLKKTN